VLKRGVSIHHAVLLLHLHYLLMLLH